MCPHRIFLTGEPGCGKTTVIKKVTAALLEQGVSVGGVISDEIRPYGVRLGFTVEDLKTHEVGILAHVKQTEGPHVGKYRVNLHDISRVAVRGIERATEDAEIIIVDELGPMELCSPEFIAAMEKALGSPKHFVGTIHRRAMHPLVKAIRQNPGNQIVEVNARNREAIPRQIEEQVMSHD